MVLGPVVRMPDAKSYNFKSGGGGSIPLSTTKYDI